LKLALVFFIPGTVSLALTFLFLFVPWGIRFSEVNPDHPFVLLSAFMFWSNLFGFPIVTGAGLFAVFRGVRGLYTAGSLPGNPGKWQSMAGIALGLLVMVQPLLFVCLVGRSGAFVQ
jgi:hypothetical protein